MSSAWRAPSGRGPSEHYSQRPTWDCDRNPQRSLSCTPIQRRNYRTWTVNPGPQRAEGEQRPQNAPWPVHNIQERRGEFSPAWPSPSTHGHHRELSRSVSETQGRQTEFVQDRCRTIPLNWRSPEEVNHGPAWSQPRRRDRRSNTSLPSDWVGLKNIGDVIGGTRFICFKAPFDTLSSYPQHMRHNAFTTERLLEEMAGRGIKLGMIVDLTDTGRYYNPEKLSGTGIRHLKMRIPGKGVPSEAHYRHFQTEVDKFLSSTVDEKVGVHCTHGINRTGWFVCRYLIERTHYNAEEALKIFGDARGHGIYRDYIVDDLRKRRKNHAPSQHQNVAPGDYNDEKPFSRSTSTTPVVPEIHVPG